MDDEQPSNLIAPTGGAASTSSQLCVLLVEDDRSVRRYLEVTLQRSGYRVITASDGLEAMKLALSSQIDALVTDAIMPHLSGQQLAAFFRGNPKLARIPIVLLTGQENKQNASSPHNLIDTFLYKPVNNQELIRGLAQLLKRGDPNATQA
jgi:chemotaxis family two-component system sensor histidine kinase/response regulator PixL